MKKQCGYGGYILTINLTEMKITKELLKEDFITKYIGGEGFSSRILWERLRPGVDALAPENPLIFAIGAMCGSPMTSTARMFSTSKSPITGGVVANSCGGHFAPHLKFNGFDVLVIEGKAAEPVYLFIEDGEVEVRRAQHLWGKNLNETGIGLKQELGDDIQILCIGPAGEKLIRDALIAHDYHAFGKGGGGAVMGAKYLKAIVVRETCGAIPQHDPEGMIDLLFDADEKIKKNVAIKMMSELTTFCLIPAYNQLCGGGVRHFQQGYWDKFDVYNPEKMLKELLIDNLDEHKKANCWNCRVKCAKVLEPKKGPYRGHRHAAKAECITAWGWKNMIDDLDSYCEISYRVQQAGLELVSAAEWTAWIAESQEKGILTPEDTGGVEVRFGDGEAILKILEMTFKREGFGDIMAEGVQMASRVIGKGSEEYAMTCKGLAMEGENWRVDKTALLACATAERGAAPSRPWTFLINHGAEVPGLDGKVYLMTDATGLTETFGPTAEKEFGKWFKAYKEVFYGTFNCMGFCMLNMMCAPWDTTFATKIYNTWTGRSLTTEDTLRAGERNICLQRAINAREGFGRKDDYPPQRFLKEPIKGGPGDGRKVEDYDGMLDEYYSVSGFDAKTGWPTRAKLEELGLKDVADKLY